MFKYKFDSILSFQLSKISLTFLFVIPFNGNAE
jgi:hypothetical protein